MEDMAAPARTGAAMTDYGRLRGRNCILIERTPMMDRAPAARRRRGNRNFDVNAIRRAQIMRHAMSVGAMDSDDRDRWLLMLALHNPGAKDPVYYLMRTAERLGGRITQAEAIAIADEAAEIPRCWSADRVAKFLGLTYRQRTLLGITAIGACDFSKRARKQQRKHKDKMAKEAKRRANGALCRAEYEAKSTAAEARAQRVSRMTIYRRRKRAEQAKNLSDVTGASTAYFLSSEDGPVTPAGVEGTSERGFAPKKARGLPSSQTATTMAADVHEALPLELRLLALGLPMPENLARAA
jgi:hypothetical protein